MVIDEKEFEVTIPDHWVHLQDANVKYYWYADTAELNYGVNIFSEYTDDETTLDELFDFVCTYNSKYVNKFMYYDVSDVYIGKLGRGTEAKIIDSEMTYRNSRYRMFQTICIKDGIRYTFNVIRKADLAASEFQKVFQSIFKTATFKY